MQDAGDRTQTKNLCESRGHRPPSSSDKRINVHVQGVIYMMLSVVCNLVLSAEYVMCVCVCVRV